MEEKVGNKCGIVVTNDLHDALAFGESLEHRGREACGVAAISNEQIDVVKWLGRTREFRKEIIFNVLSQGDYHTFFFHNRYATHGEEHNLLKDAHPHALNPKGVDNKGNHIVMLGCEAAIIHNGQVDLKRFPEVKDFKLTTTCDSEALLHFYKKFGEEKLMKQFTTGGTLAIADISRPEIIAMRDATGIKPGIIGRKDKYYGITSEDIAFRKNGGRFIEELEPGTIYYFERDGKNYKKRKILECGPRMCFFEWTYLSHEDTILNGASVLRTRELLGEILAEEFKPKDATLVTFLPDSPEIAARRYSDRTEIPFEAVFYKKIYERSFLGTTLEQRANSIYENLHIYTHILPLLKEQVLIIIDDSIIRGNNAIKARNLAREAGVKKLYLINYIPPVGPIGSDGIPRGCLFGVDMPPNDRFVSREQILDSTNKIIISQRNRTNAEINRALEMNVVYISPEGMFKAFEAMGISRERLCSYCIGGKHPALNLEVEEVVQ